MTKHPTIPAMLAAGLAAGLAQSASAQEAGNVGGFEVSANVGLFSDYRFRGISFSDEDFAVQGGIDLGHESGFYLGTWASSLDDDFAGADTEIDVYGGYSREVNGFEFDIGAVGYLYPGSSGLNYIELYGSVGHALGPVGVSIGVAYAPSSDNLGNQDNVYLYTSAEYEIPNTGVALSGSLGWEDGAFADDKIDWTIGLSRSIIDERLSVSLTYVDTDQPGGLADSTVVFSIGAEF